MPTGLPKDSRRTCDDEAFGFVRERWRSVFHVPTEDAVNSASQEEASRLNEEATGYRVSAQVYSLRDKLRELANQLDDKNDHTDLAEKVIEVHPEVSFRELINLGGVVERK